MQNRDTSLNYYAGQREAVLPCTPEAECQWWADRLGDEKTRCRLDSAERLQENAHDFPPPEANSSGGGLKPSGRAARADEEASFLV